MVVWEAQYGDFANTAQVTLDQFITTSEDKWLRSTGLVVSLPHGYDATGPEHSSAKIERFLQLSESDSLEDTPNNYKSNIRVVIPTTAANVFHALRRQVATRYRKPLIYIGPKTLIRLKQTHCKLEELGPGTHFKPVIGDVEAEKDADSVRKIILCSGKVVYDLLSLREKGELQNTAIIRIEV